MPFEEAEQVADEIYSRISRKFVADGIITSEEREKLDGLAAAS